MHKIQYMSDLHLERLEYKYDWTIVPAAPTLILAGDIGLFRDYSLYLSFLRKQCTQLDRVLLVPGNHEFYHLSRAEGLKAAERLALEPELESKLTILNRARVDLGDGVVVLGCTLHSHIAPDYTALTNDFEYISDWSVAKHNAEHALDRLWLKDTLAEVADTAPEKRVVVVTHYAPSFEGTCHPKHERGELNQCFCSDVLEEFRSWKGAKMLRGWVFGHTHWNARFDVRTAEGSKVMVVSNQRCCENKGLSWWQRWRRWREFDGGAVVEVQSPFSGSLLKRFRSCLVCR